MVSFNRNRFSLDLKVEISKNSYTLREVEEITGISRATISRACNGKNIEVESFANLLLFIDKEAENYFDYN